MPPSHRPRRVIGRTGVCAHDPPHLLTGLKRAFPATSGTVPGHRDQRRLRERSGSTGTCSGPRTWPGGLPVRHGRGLPAAGISRPTTHPRGRWSNRPAAASYGGFSRPRPPVAGTALPNGDILVNDDYNDRVIVIDPITHRIVWQYGHTGRPGSALGYPRRPGRGRPDASQLHADLARRDDGTAIGPGHRRRRRSAVGRDQRITVHDLHAQRQERDGMILKLASPSGMPMIVMHSRIPATRWPSASSQPNRMIQMMLPMTAADAHPPSRGDGPAERPQHIVRDPERGDPERDRDDQEEQEEADQPGQRVGDGHPDAAEHEPDHVEDGSHRIPRLVPRAPALPVGAIKAPRRARPAWPAPRGGTGTGAARLARA